MLRSLALASLLACGASAVQAADTYAIDPVHAFATFKVGHLGVSNSWGRFNKIDGTITWDADLAKSAITVNVLIDSVDTDNDKRDQHLKSPDYFNAKQFPTATFTSTSWKAAGDKAYEVTGNFTLCGVTKPLTVPVVLVGQGDTPMQDTRVGFDAVIAFKRSDFGMNQKLAFVGDDVTLYVSIEGIKK
jgi:polyisoprenoid-binding protein YceI